jgi:hypothetical protein
MIHQVQNVIDKVALKQQLRSKQLLYAQMQKDQITGPVRDKLSAEIGQLNTKLCSHGH